MNLIRKFLPFVIHHKWTVLLTTLLAGWLALVSWKFDNDNFSASVFLLIAGAFFLAPIAVWELVHKLGKQKNAKKDEYELSVRHMRRWAEIWAFLAVLCAALALIQIAKSFEQHSSANNIRALGRATSLSMKTFDEGRCQVLPWAKGYCRDIKNEFEQLYWELIKENRSHRKAKNHIGSVTIKIQELVAEKSLGFEKSEVEPILRILETISVDDPALTTFMKLQLGLLTFLMAFLAGVRKIALAFLA